jgi:hypothetical protein
MFASKSSFKNPDLKLGFMITIPVEFFPLNPIGKPFHSPGSMVTAYPDFRHYTTRDYGNRVGIYRLLRILKAYDIKANFAVNSEVAVRYRQLFEDIVNDGHEVIAHGVDTDCIHFGGMDTEVERDYIDKCLSTLREYSGQPVKGWLSPAYSESFHTPDLVAEKGCTYIGDWSNDDLPYAIHTKYGKIVSLPISQEISDRQIIINYKQTEESFEEQVKDQFDCLYNEVETYGPRIFSLTLVPYISGLPFRIKMVEEILNYVLNKSGVMALTGQEVVEGFSL